MPCRSLPACYTGCRIASVSCCAPHSQCTRPPYHHRAMPHFASHRQHAMPHTAPPVCHAAHRTISMPCFTPHRKHAMLRTPLPPCHAAHRTASMPMPCTTLLACHVAHRTATMPCHAASRPHTPPFAMAISSSISCCQGWYAHCPHRHWSIGCWCSGCRTHFFASRTDIDSSRMSSAETPLGPMVQHRCQLKCQLSLIESCTNSSELGRHICPCALLAAI
jgi:hypothetical protein